MYLLMLVLLLPIATIVDGWALSTLWGWFIVPLGVPAIGIAHAFGISCTVSLFRSRFSTRKKEQEREIDEWFWEWLGTWIFKVAIVLALGWFAANVVGL
jgi:hypothetical protein